MMIVIIAIMIKLIELKSKQTKRKIVTKNTKNKLKTKYIEMKYILQP